MVIGDNERITNITKIVTKSGLQVCACEGVIFHNFYIHVQLCVETFYFGCYLLENIPSPLIRL